MINQIPPKKLFLIDGLGALLSAFLLGLVLVKFENYFGIPPATLYFLAFLPCLFAAYDFYVFFKVKKSLSSYLKIIAVVNFIYCCISLGLAFYHQQSLTFLGWGYILGEIFIVVVLAMIEFNVANLLEK